MNRFRLSLLLAVCVVLAGAACDDDDDDDGGGGIADDAYEENDSVAQAYDLSAYENTWLSSIAGPGILVGPSAPVDLDYYKVTVGSPANLVIECTFSHATSDIDIALLDAGEATIGFSDSITDDETIDEPVSSGVYYIEIWNCEDGVGVYDLRWYTY